MPACPRVAEGRRFPLLHLPRLWLRRLAWLTLAVYFAGGLLFLGLRHFALPQVPAYRAEVAGLLSRSLGLPVEIDSLSADWEGLRPTFRLGGLTIKDAAYWHAFGFDQFVHALTYIAIVALLALPVNEPGLTAHPVYDEDFVLAVGANSGLARATDVELEVLGRQPLLLLDEGHCLRDQALEVCVLANVADAGHDAARASSLATIVQLVAAGMGATLLPATAVPVEARGASLGIATFAAPIPGRRVGMVWRATNSRAEQFDDFAEMIRHAVVNAGLPARPVREPITSAR